ncbi:MAG: HD domain-containing protein [Bacillota bacterium]
MLKDQMDDLHSWFAGYVRGFYSSDPGIQAAVTFKEHHTGRVCGNIVRIAGSLDLPDEDILLAEAVALLHDVGRFRQYHVYRTFNDRRSENHALLGVKEIEKSGVLNSLASGEKDIITTAVKYHGSFNLPEDLKSRTLLFTRLIRDADKLDILDTFTSYYCRENRDPDPVIESGLPDTPGCSPVLVENLLRGEGCNYGDVRNFNDRKLLLLSWVYDINFSHTLSEIIQNGYIKTLIDLLPGTEDIRAVSMRLHDYASRRLAGQGEKNTV